ncbi:MAG: alcohol dehydrogenase [Methanobacteriota archaeon]|nr:MAG: alcohol dehydrogenase [Euryarchaeota archaeon]
MQGKMFAALFHEHGDASKIKYEEVPIPQISDDEVLVRVEYCSLNRLDIFVRNGSPSLNIPLPHVSGSDFVGTIAEIGEKVTGYDIGDRVAVNAVWFCNKCERCLEGEHSLCNSFKMIGEHLWGGFAQYAKVPARNLVKIPENVDSKAVAALGLTTLTAWRMLKRAEIQPGSIVVVPGAGGGLSTAGIQIAKHFGAKVIALTSTEKKIEHAKRLGADIVLNYKEEEKWGKKILELTKGRGADIVFESVGQATWQNSLRCLRKGGTLVTAGATTGFQGMTNIGAVFWLQLRIIGSTMANMKEFREAMELIFSGKIKPVIDKVFPLNKLADAERYLEDGMHTGKILIEIP